MNGTDTLPARGGLPPAAFITFGVVAASLAIAAIVAVGGVGGVGGFGGRGGDGGIVPPPGTGPSAPAVTPAPSHAPSEAPSQAPSEEPSEAPTPEPTPIPAPEETDGGHDAMPIKVDLDNATGADVHVDVVDYTDSITGATSGTPGDGASVPGYTLVVEDVDAHTLKLTWIDYPIDNALTLSIYRVDGGYRLVLVQPEPSADSDAIGFDRELILTFDEPVSSSQVEAFLQNGLDTPG